MRLVVTGREGQVATALADLSQDGVEVVLLGRPELDLERPETIAPALAAVHPDVVVSAAAYTAVDQAESDEARARLINALATGVFGGGRRGWARPCCTFPPTTSSMGPSRSRTSKATRPGLGRCTAHQT